MPVKHIYMQITSKIICIYFFLIAAASVNAQVVDKIAAQVGDNIILWSDVEKKLVQAHAGGSPTTTYCEILEELMYQELLVNQAKLDSLVVTDDQVNAEMENRIRIIENKIGSRQKMEEFYGKSITEIKDEFRGAIRERLLAEEMERTITGSISVTPKEVKQFYESLPEDSIPFINTALTFQQIVHYPAITKEDKLLAYNKLTEIRTAIIGGKNFDTQARIHSMDPGSASQGGKIEASRGMMVPPFEAAVFSLNEGEISDVFESDYGYHIVKLIKRKGDDYTCQHILIVPEFNPSTFEQSAIKMDSCYNLLNQKKISWDEAVIRFSNDEMTKQNKGIITNPITGEQTWDMEDLNQVDQQIFLLTDVLEKGEFSSPNLYMNIFDRKQGVRIVRLMERTLPHKANLKEDYALIKRAAENEKKQRIIREWTQGKIGNAYVKIDSDYQQCIFKNDWIKL